MKKPILTLSLALSAAALTGLGHAYQARSGQQVAPAAHSATGPAVRSATGQAGPAPQSAAGGQVAAFDAGLGAAGLRVAVGDVTGDDRPEILVAAAPGVPAIVNAFDPASLALVDSFTAFDSFLGGVFVG